MGKYRKKPVVIEAVQYTGDVNAAFDWVGKPKGISGPGICGLSYDYADERLSISTFEGAMLVSKGDWIIRGVKGELYPCKPDIFEATYEAVDDSALEAAGPHDPEAHGYKASSQTGIVTGCPRCAVLGRTP